MDDYGLPDLRQLMASRANFGTPGIHLPPDSFRHFTPPPPPPPPPHFLVVGGDQQLVVPGGGSLVDHHHYNNNTLTTATSAAAPPHPPTTAMLYGNNGSDQLEHVSWGNNNNMDDGGNNSSRWPRQETLTLLEIRSALDSSFKETNHKGPLWDQVSRIMGEEHGYQRSGKKCKEKFENLYKYYKKTKEGKAGRQDGKNYRFFRQLEAIYGDHHQTRLAPPTFINPLAPNRDFHFENNQEIVVQHHQHQGLDSFSNNSAEFDQTSSSENNSCARPVVKKRWREKVEGFVSSQIGKVMKAQEEWMEKMVKSIEQREEERMVEEEERRKREAARFDHQVNEFWAKERAWVEARDAAMMKALSKNPRKEIVNSWSQHEVASLIELRTNLELRIQQEGGRRCLKEGIWEEIAMKMGCLGYTRSVGECKEKWEDIKMSNMYFSRLSFYDHEGGEISRERWPEGMMRLQLMDDQGISPASSSKPDVSSSSFRIPSNGGENLWEESRHR